MSNMDLERLLKSVGQRVFVTYYREFADDSLDNADVADMLLRQEGFTDKACLSRTTHARDIFGQGLEIQALQFISGSTRAGNEATVKKAQDLLEQLS